MVNVELVQACKDTGLGIGAFGLCCWIVRFIVMRMVAVIDKLSSNMDVFTANVKKEHEQANDHHQKLMEQHDEMIKVLGRINGYKE